MEIAILFLFGISIGSFLNVVIDRLPFEESIIAGRSHCDFCKKTLAWYDLIPLFSFVFLRGRCRDCHSRLSLQYPLIEILTGLAFVAIFLIEQRSMQFSYTQFMLDLCLIASGISLFMMDVKYTILSDKVLLVATLCIGIKIVLTSPLSLLPLLGIGVVSSFPLLLLFIFTKGRGMGFGDVKLAGVMGFLLGFPLIIVAYYVAFLTGALYAIILIMLGKKKFKGSTIAFGPFLLLATVVTALWGNILWQYVQHMLGL